MLKLNLGCSDKHIPGFKNVDIIAPCDIICDLREGWIWGDSTVSEIIAHDIIEHLPDKIHTMNEMWRVLAPGATAKIEVPTTDGRGAWQDPTHVSFWNRNSFWYYEYMNPYRERFYKGNGIEACFKIEGCREWSTSIEVFKLSLTLRAIK